MPTDAAMRTEACHTETAPMPAELSTVLRDAVQSARLAASPNGILRSANTTAAMSTEPQQDTQICLLSRVVAANVRCLQEGAAVIASEFTVNS